MIKSNDDSKILYNSQEGDRTKMSTPLFRVQFRGDRGGNGQKGGQGKMGAPGAPGIDDEIKKQPVVGIRTVAVIDKLYHYKDAKKGGTGGKGDRGGNTGAPGTIPQSSVIHASSQKLPKEARLEVDLGSWDDEFGKGAVAGAGISLSLLMTESL